MKINNQDLKLNNLDLDVDKNLLLKKSITTDVNILLNRVKLDKKRDLKKRLIFLGLLVVTISLFVIFAIV